MENEHFPEFDDVPVGGYILTFIHEDANGHKTTKIRFVKPEHKEAVEKWIEPLGFFVQEEVVDEFLKTLQ